MTMGRFRKQSSNKRTPPTKTRGCRSIHLNDRRVGWERTRDAETVLISCWSLTPADSCSQRIWAVPAGRRTVRRRVLALLMWVYYSAQMFFFGAELTRIFASTEG